MSHGYQKAPCYFPSPSLPNKCFFSSFLAFKTNLPTKVYCDIMISAKSDKPTKDGRSQENYKKQNKTKEKSPVARRGRHMWSDL